MVTRASKHGRQRVKQRVGIKSAAVDGLVERVLAEGVTHAEAGGHLKRYMDKLFLSHGTANQMRVYNEHVYIIREGVLVTVLPLPHSLRRIATSVVNKRK